MPSDLSKNSGHGAGSANESYMAGDHSSSTIRGSYMHEEGEGVEYGLSHQYGFDSDYLYNVQYNNARDPGTGNAGARPEPYQDHSRSVKEKGHNFDLY